MFLLNYGNLDSEFCVGCDLMQAGNHGDLVDHNENKCMDDSARPIADTNMWTNEANKMNVNVSFFVNVDIK